MSLFEDVIEVHYNPENRFEGRRHIDTLRYAMNQVASSPEDVSIVLDWESLDAIAHPLDVEPEVTGHVPRDHVELRPEKVELALDTRALVHGVESGQAFGLVMDPRAVRYSNTISDDKKVVAIDFTDA